MKRKMLSQRFGFRLLVATALHFFLVVTQPAVAADGSCDANSNNNGSTKNLLNSAFVFVKPHANTPSTRSLVKEKLTGAGIDVLSESIIDGKDIDEKQLIDQHYYAIASKATILKAKDIPVPEDKFEEAFGESWNKVLKEGRACNAMEACEIFGCSARELNDAWQSNNVQKFGGGFYCAPVSVNGKPEMYVFNAFFMNMRNQFVGEGKAIYYYVVEWDPATLSWSDFRNKLLGPTDPSVAPKGSIRRTILDQYKELGLSSQPNKGDNGVHASASPFEGLAEKLNWLGMGVEDDAFGRALLSAGMSKQRILDWSKDPQINLDGNGRGSVFDALEDMDVYHCLDKLTLLNDANAE
jgi:nucleoside diphosphate kinase